MAQQTSIPPLPAVSCAQLVDVINITPSACTKVSTNQTFTYKGLDPLVHKDIVVSNAAYSSNSYAQTSGIGVAGAFCNAKDVLTITFYNDWALTGGTGTPAAGYYSLVVY